MLLLPLPACLALAYKLGAMRPSLLFSLIIPLSYQANNAESKAFENNAVWCESSEAALFDTGVRKAALDVGGLLLPREVFWKRILAKSRSYGAVVNVKGCTE